MKAKINSVFTSLAVGFALTLALLWLMGSDLPPARAADRTVCASGCDHTTIQAAVDAADDGDVIKVAEGFYTDLHLRDAITQVVYVSKTVTIRGGYTTAFTEPPDPDGHPTTVNAGGLGRGLVISGPVTVTVEGLHITGGDASGLGGGPWNNDAGGGVYVITATATIRNNRVFSNTADSDSYGGGLYLDYSAATLSGNTVTSNTASFGSGLCLHHSPATLDGNTVTANAAGLHGGGLYLSSSDATLSGNTVTSNTAQLFGGGLHLDHSTATLSANTITSNTAQQSGGGLYLAYSPATLNANTVTANTAAGYHGGGLYLSSSAATLSGNTVTSNTAEYRGGGLRLNESNATLVNTIIADNRAGATGCGLYVDGSSPRLLHTTIARNSGGSGVYVTGLSGNYSTAVFTNTILVSHTVGIYVSGGNTATLEATLWDSGPSTGGSGTINRTNDHTGDPAFVDPAGGDYHISIGSAAIDAGVEAGVAYDIDDDLRPAGGGPDIGADEVSLSLRKRAPAAATAGEPITYTLILTNNNPFAVTNVVVSDTVPAGATYVSGGSYASGVVSWTVASIAPSGGVAQVGFVVTATATITNSQYRVVTSTEGLSTGFGPPVMTVVTAPPCHALTDVGITGPGTGYTDTLYAFTAVVTPSNATLPITYTWQATEQTPTTHIVNDISDTVQFTWDVTGTQTLTVTAVNECSVVVSNTHAITIESPLQLDHHVYLPLVLR